MSYFFLNEITEKRNKPKNFNLIYLCFKIWNTKLIAHFMHILEDFSQLYQVDSFTRSSGCAVEGGPRGTIPRSRSGGPVVRRYPSSKVRSSSCARLEEPWRDTPCPRRGGCTGAGGPRGAIPHWSSGRAAVKRYPSSKVRSSSCVFLEQPWRDTPHPR